MKTVREYGADALNEYADAVEARLVAMLDEVTEEEVEAFDVDAWVGAHVDADALKDMVVNAALLAYDAGEITRR
jgi:hypothetical protein